MNNNKATSASLFSNPSPLCKFLINFLGQSSLFKGYNEYVLASMIGAVINDEVPSLVFQNILLMTTNIRK